MKPWLNPSRFGQHCSTNLRFRTRWWPGSQTGAFDEFIATDYVGHLGDTRMDLAELERVERSFAISFPDAKHSIDDILAENDRVVLRVTSRGTHRGEFQGIAPTDRPVEFTGS
jgi:predicted ester cyclase